MSRTTTPAQFTAQVAQAGCAHFIVHARKAVLGGLVAARESRGSAAALRCGAAAQTQISRMLWIGVNGGLRSARKSEAALLLVRWGDAGTRGLSSPGVLAELHEHVFNDGWRCPEPAGDARAHGATPSVKSAPASAWQPLHAICSGLCAGLPGARRYRHGCPRARARWASVRPRRADSAARLMREAAGAVRGHSVC
jgi:tRNA-dihydrouridine synthase A